MHSLWVTVFTLRFCYGHLAIYYPETAENKYIKEPGNITKAKLLSLTDNQAVLCNVVRVHSLLKQKIKDRIQTKNCN